MALLEHITGKWRARNKSDHGVLGTRDRPVDKPLTGPDDQPHDEGAAFDMAKKPLPIRRDPRRDVPRIGQDEVKLVVNKRRQKLSLKKLFQRRPTPPKRGRVIVVQR